VAPRRIDDDELIPIFLETLNTVNGNLDRICLRIGSIERNLGLRGILLELVKGTSSESVGAD
jgi:hypothetical protein